MTTQQHINGPGTSVAGESTDIGTAGANSWRPAAASAVKLTGTTLAAGGVTVAAALATAKYGPRLAMSAWAVFGRATRWIASEAATVRAGLKRGAKKDDAG